MDAARRRTDTERSVPAVLGCCQRTCAGAPSWFTHLEGAFELVGPRGRRALEEPWCGRFAGGKIED